MIRRPPRSTRTDTLFPYTTLFRSSRGGNCFSSACAGPRLLPDRLAAAGQAEVRPQAVDALDDGLIHADLAAPRALCLRRPLVGGVETDLGAEAVLRRGEVEVVDRRPLDDGDVAGRRSEEHTAEEWVSTGRSRWSPYHQK